MRSKKIVLDSCVFNKLFLNETDRQLAIDFIKQANTSGVRILVPSIFIYEVVAVASRNRYRTRDIYQLILSYESNNMNIIHPDDKIIDKAIEISDLGQKQSGYPSFYDAVYHALAIINDCDFITADKKHYAKAKHLGHIKLLSDIEIN